MLKLKLQYFGHLMWTANSLEKTLMLGRTEGKGEEGGKGWDGWLASLIQWTWTWAKSGRWWGTAAVLKVTKSPTLLSHWRTNTYICYIAYACGMLSCFSRVQPYRPIEFNSCDAIDCSPPGSSVHRILQARALEWVAMPSKGFFWLRDWTCISYIADEFFTTESPGKPICLCVYISPGKMRACMHAHACTHTHTNTHTHWLPL